MRAGLYAEAIVHYARVLIDKPVLGKSISANFSIARKKYRRSRQCIERPRVGICGYSPVGRATTLARLYETFADVEMIGRVFPFLRGVNESGMGAQNCRILIPKHSFGSGDESRFLDEAIAFVADHPYDIIHLSKFQVPNVFVCILYKLIWGAKILVDLEEDDLAFVGNVLPTSIADSLEWRGRLSEFQALGGEDFARLTTELAKEFDGVTMRDDLTKQLIDHELFSKIRKMGSLHLLEGSSSSNDAKKLQRRSEQLLNSSSTVIGESLAGCISMFMGEAGMAFANLPEKNLLKLPISSDHWSSNVAQTVENTPKSASPKLPITALIITWDVGHNPLGRSYMLAEVLQRVVRHSLLVGFQFSRYGDSIWEPVRDGGLPVITLPGGNLPDFYESLQKISARIKPDIVIACKPRLPSVALGMMIKERWGCPLIMDIDDHELSFFSDPSELDLNQILSMSAGSASKYVEPYSEFWTRLSQNLCKFADEIIVSNIALKKEFGGTIVPHVRDENTFDPLKFDKTKARERHGVPKDAKILLFFGTPRVHKGIDTLARAVNELSDTRFCLLVVGTAPDRRVTANLDKLAPGRIIYLPNQPFSAIPEILAMADVVCLPQDEGHPVSKFQLPAKAIDAVAMSIPLLVSNTPPLMQLVDDQVAELVNVGEISSALERLTKNPLKMDQWKKQVRGKFLERYSYASAALVLRDLIKRTLAQKPRSSVFNTAKLVEASRHVLGVPPVFSTSQKSIGVDIVLFWKQNDTGLYGRRHDMVIKYLASRSDIRKVVVFDAPISEHDMVKKQHANKAANQDRWIYVSTYEKMLGVRDTQKVSYNVFVYPPGRYRNKDEDTTKPHLSDGYIPYVSDVLSREGVNASEAIFWLYPKNYLAPVLIQYFRPAKVVVDVVDDHRAWPNTSEAEKKRLTENYRATLALADVAFTNCEPVRASMKEFFPDILMVPNGCDGSLPAVAPKYSAEFEAFCEWPGKTIGYIGNLESKIDIDLLDQIALRFQNCQLVLIGSTHANPAVLQLKRHSNVRMPGVVPYDEAGAWVSRFDVGLVPHLNTAMTENMNPLKVFVYFSFGVPVVSTEISNIDRGNSLLHVASDKYEFIEEVDRILQCDKPHIKEMEAYISANTWDARFSNHVSSLLRA